MKRHILESIVEDASYGSGDASEAPSQEAWVSMQKRFGKEFTLEDRARALARGNAIIKE